MSRRSPVDAIFKDIYLVRVYAYQTQDLDEIRAYGSRTSGAEDYDKWAATDKITCAWTINKMVEAFRSGKSFWLVEEKDAEQIYQAIQRHIAMWAEVRTKSFNHVNPPTDDLMALDEMAAKLYPHAQPYFQRPDASIGFGTLNLSSLPTSNNSSRLNKPKPKISGHASMAGFFRDNRERAAQDPRSINQYQSDDQGIPVSYRKFGRSR